MSEQVHGGRAVSGALKALGVQNVFTLTGGHIFPIFDGCKEDGIRLIDTRHEQSAAFAAEGWARLTRTLGVCAITAGPGVTNAMSPLAQARFNGAPVLALAGRAPSFRWGQGSLQEMDHPPFVDPIAPAKTVGSTDEVAAEVIAAARGALGAPRGPRFLDMPLDVLFNMTDVPTPDAELPRPLQPDTSDIDSIAALIADSERPAIIAGSGVYLDGAWTALQRLAEKAGLPVFMNGQGRGCVPADHPLAFSRARSKALKEADLVVVAGTPLDFRLGFGDFGGAKVVHLDTHPDQISAHVNLAASAAGSLDIAFTGLADALDPNGQTKAWLEALEEAEAAKREGAGAELASSVKPIHPMRIYGELNQILERDAIVIGDGGDFVSYAGREIRSYEPGSWLDPGPFGCLGVGPGYAIAARLAHPDRQVCVLFGDGAIGFSGMELETLVRLALPVVCIVGNNGIWGLEKHPMRAIYGYDIVADLRPEIRYDKMMEAFGGRGEMVTDPGEVGPAIRRAFDSGAPSLVNIITDPAVAYPRSANLA